MRAFVDESLRQETPGLYVVAAAVVTSTDLEGARAAARSVLLPRQRRFHWHAESEAQRHRMLEAIAGAGVTVRGYASSPVPRAKAERARALCIDRLLWDFLDEDLAVAEVVFESRQEHNDRRDRRVVANAQRARRAPAGLRYGHERPSVEPLLWLPDAAAGAVAAHVAGETSAYLEVLGEVATVVEVPAP